MTDGERQNDGHAFNRATIREGTTKERTAKSGKCGIKRPSGLAHMHETIPREGPPE
jgi:hypothetical protein